MEESMQLWVSSALNADGDAYGQAAVIADSREEALTKIRRHLDEVRESDLLPVEQYRHNLLAAADVTLCNYGEEAAVDWSPAEGVLRQ
jgi:hypothetical protein